MDVLFETADDVTVLIPVGNLVASETDSFNTQIAKLVDDTTRFIVLDMSRINFMDSSGLDKVMALSKLATNSGGVFVCAALPDNVLKVFRVTWADQRIAIAATRSDALLMIQGLRDKGRQ